MKQKLEAVEIVTKHIQQTEYVYALCLDSLVKCKFPCKYVNYIWAFVSVGHKC